MPTENQNHLIQPAPVERDSEGYWWHPDLTIFEEGQAAESKAWVVQQGLTISKVEMEYEVDTDTDPFFQDGDSSCAHWEPSKPDGDGWFCLAISCTDDGPICYWARRETAV